MNKFKISGTIGKVGSLTGGLSMPQGSVMNDYERLTNKPLVFDSSANFPPTGNAERLYIATNVNKIYYWTGITYTEISGSGGGGTDGKSPYIGENKNWYIYNDLTHTWIDTGVRAEGIKGADGTNGLDGKDGYTPIKGTDYFTPADIASLGINPTIITDLSATTQTVTLTNNTEYRYGTLTSLAITWTTSDIRCSMAFTGGAGVTFSITAGTKIVGTDVIDNVFTPVVNKHYNLGFEFDGVNRTVYVSGVS